MHEFKRLDWGPAGRLVTASRGYFALEGERLRALLGRSRSALNPLDDPMLVDLGMHRWLAREEAYSDWLQWTLQQLTTAQRVFDLLGVGTPEEAATCGATTPTIEREPWVPEGAEGYKGRLDLVVRYPNVVVIVIEVKRGLAEEAELNKQAGYRLWLNRQPEHRHDAILLAVDGTGEHYPGDFRLRRWADLCIGLRRMLPALVEENGVISAAMVAAFVGAVEQNLLGFSAIEAQRAVGGVSGRTNAALGHHLMTVFAEGGVWT